MILNARIPVVIAAISALAFAPRGIAATYWNDDQTCAECHPTQYEKHSQSIHLQMIRPATGEFLTNVHGNLKAPKAPSTNDFTHVMGGWYKEESYIKAQVVNGKTNYTVTNFEWNPIKGTYANDKAFRDWLVRCAGCHTTGYEPKTQEFQQFNIHCESCHGPAAEHVLKPGQVKPIKDTSSEGCGHCHIRAESAATADFPAKAFNFPIGYVLGDPSSLKFVPEAITNAASFYPDKTSNRHRQQYLDTHYPGVRSTKHYEQGISCTKCHDPHSSGIVTAHNGPLPAGKFGIKVYDNVSGATNAVEWDGEGLLRSREQLCTTCHGAIKNEHVHGFNPVALAAAQTGKVTCVDCHMPDVINIDSATLRGALHTHTYHTMRGEKSVQLGADLQPNSCTYRCHQDKGANKAERAAWAAAYTGVTLAPAVAARNFELHLKGLKGFDYTIEGSADFTTWTPITTLNAAEGEIHVEGAMTNYHFFRALEKGQKR